MTSGEHLNLEDLAARPPWEADRTRALEGQVRGGLLKDWGVHVERRWGPAAVTDLLEELDYDLPIRPDLGRWYPVWVQLRLTELIIARHLDGDPKNLIEIIWEDARRSAGPIAAAALKLAGPLRVLQRAPGSFGGLYDQVEATAEIADEHLTVRYDGPEHVDHPTWQFLQALSLTGLFNLAGVPQWTLRAQAPRSGFFELRLDLPGQ